MGIKERLSILGIGIIGNQAMVYAFNWVLYPMVIWWLGLGAGFAVMTVLSFLVCYGLILFYDWAKQDWLGVETIKELRGYCGDNVAGRLASWIMKRSEPVVLIFLSVKFDPFITTIYMRQGAGQYNGMVGRDWKVFIASLIIGDLYWAIAVFTGISIIEYLLALLR